MIGCYDGGPPPPPKHSLTTKTKKGGRGGDKETLTYKVFNALSLSAPFCLCGLGGREGWDVDCGPFFVLIRNL